MIGLKDKPQFVDLDPGFKPLPKYGHLSEKTPEFLVVEDAIFAAYDQLWKLPDIPTFRQVAGDSDAALPPGGPDRYRDVKTELLHFPARDGHLIELKVYKSPHVAPDATLMYRMHGGGMAHVLSALSTLGAKYANLIYLAWCVGGHEVDGAENVYAATNPNIVVVSVDYRLYVLPIRYTRSAAWKFTYITKGHRRIPSRSQSRIAMMVCYGYAIYYPILTHHAIFINSRRLV